MKNSMGVRIILMMVMISLLSCSVLSPQKKEKNKAYKKMALCTCVFNNYGKMKADLELHDVSKGDMMQEHLSLSDYSVLKLDSFVVSETGNYHRLKLSHTLSEDSANNAVMKYCIDFYESRELDRFVKRLD